MKFSIFTPTHDLSYIDTPLKSLTEQSNKDFEWILLLNGDAVNEVDALTSKLEKNEIKHKIITSSIADLLESKSLAGNNITLYRTDSCPWCKKAEDFLKEKGLDFEDRNVQDPKHGQELNEKLQAAEKKPGGVPVVDFNGTLLTGYLELTEVFNNNIGALKKKCCGAASGEILVELDHDDALTPDCLEELSKAFDEGYDFCYSDDYMVEMKNDKGECIAPFSSEWGWSTEQDDEGNRYHPAFDPSPLSFAYIWYAPDHVRSWRRSFYEKIGGHDATLEVCDDYELCCRSYINGKCHRIPKPLYKYFAYPERTSAGMNPDGSQGEKNKKIQELTHVIHDDYILQIAAKWADQNNLKKIDLGCGKESPSGFTGVDKESFPNGNIVFDLDEANWPFEDNSVGVFRAWNALSYLKNPVLAMKEIYRCLGDYGWVIVDVVSTDGRGAFQDPNNVSYWNTNSFWYYTKSDWARLIGSPVKFQLNRINNFHPSQFHEFHNITYAKAHLVKLPLRGFEIPIHGREI